MFTRKLWSLLAVLMVATLVVSACAPAATPATTQPPAAAPTQPPAPTAVPPTSLGTTSSAADRSAGVEMTKVEAPNRDYGGEFKSMEAVDEKTVFIVLSRPAFSPKLPLRRLPSNRPNTWRRRKARRWISRWALART
jgi:hypothetical protein